MIGAWIAGTAAVVLVLLAASNVKLRMLILREKKNDEIVLDIQGLYGLVKKRIEIPMLQFHNIKEGIGYKTEFVNSKAQELTHDNRQHINKRTITEAFENMRELFAHCFHLHDWLLGTLKHVHCTGMYWKTEVGLGDAAETAMTTGLVWGLKTSLLGFIFRFIKLDVTPEINVVPLFNQVKFFTDVIWTARIRFFYVMLAGILLLYRILKVKGGLKTWQRLLFKT
ncbi:DUF2953 domain-containing protein [Paenibacillus piri]|uniref:DUF2953 domain-containing protein n=1 Tax=Paenibacillus piri TaxID=2547395 RepID=A0A4R5KTS1_9BACL|nr:DUF2953 domain-containing protein [Paenibacillus piri]TDF99299.1 DUF2953 domain-containing protein [Paenibacillus piri]